MMTMPSLWVCLEEFTFQAGYGRFNISTVWLDAAEPERPTEDTVGQFLFSQGEDSSHWGKPRRMVKMTTSMIAEVSFRNRLMFSNWKGTDAENAIGWFWLCYQWQFFSSTRHRRRNRVGLGTTAHPDLCRGLCSPGESRSASSEDRWFFSSDLALPIVNAVWLIADCHSPIFSISYPLAVAFSEHSIMVAQRPVPILLQEFSFP